MFNPTKFAAAIALAASLTVASAFAAPTQPFIDYTAIDSTVSVPYNDSTDTTIKLDASRLFDGSQLIKLNYGFTDLDQVLRIKQVNGPAGVTVSIDDSSLSTTDNTSMLNLELLVTNDGQLSGQYPVQVILENTMTGQTTTLTVMMNAN